MEKQKKVQKRSASVQKAPSHSKGPVYHTETAPAGHSESSKFRSSTSASTLVFHLDRSELSPISNTPQSGLTPLLLQVSLIDLSTHRFLVSRAEAICIVRPGTALSDPGSMINHLCEVVSRHLPNSIAV